MSDAHRLAPLLALGESEIYTQPWPDYVAWLGLTDADIPALLQIVLHSEWQGRDWAHEPDAWAPIHAWRAIGQLRSQTAVHPLIEFSDRMVDNEWVWAELPFVFAMLGPLAIPPLTKYVTENPQKYPTAYTAINALSQIGVSYPEARPLITVFFTNRVSKAPENHPSVNGYLVRALIDLRAEEAVPAIREAFEQNLVDEAVTGEWNDVLVAFGLADPIDGGPADGDSAPRGSSPLTQSSQPAPKVGGKKKDKARRKQAKKAKKENRRRR